MELSRINEPEQQEAKVLRVFDFSDLGYRKGLFVHALMDFLLRAGAVDGDVESHLSSIIGALREGRAAMWVGMRGTELKGFMIVELHHIGDKKECFISYAYSMDKEISEAGFRQLTNWARANQCNSINMLTHRNPEAYDRLIRGKGFRKKIVEFEVTL